MARVRGFGLAEGRVVRRATLWVCAVALAGWGAAASIAQDEQVPTLHVYPNLVQVPTLVLGHDRKPIAPLVEGRFFVSLRSEEHTSELQSLRHLVCRLLLAK